MVYKTQDLIVTLMVLKSWWLEKSTEINICWHKLDRNPILLKLIKLLYFPDILAKQRLKQMEKKQIDPGGKTSLEIPLETVWVMARTLACQQVAPKPSDPPATIMTPIIRLKERISREKIPDILKGCYSFFFLSFQSFFLSFFQPNH